MRVLLDGRIIDTDSEQIDGVTVINDDTYELHEYQREMQTWQRLRYEMGIRDCTYNGSL